MAITDYIYGDKSPSSEFSFYGFCCLSKKTNGLYYSFEGGRVA